MKKKITEPYKILFGVIFLSLVFFLTARAEIDKDEALKFIQDGVASRAQIIKSASMKYEVIFSGKKDMKINGQMWIDGTSKAMEVESYEYGKLNLRFKVVSSDSVNKSFYYGDPEKKEPNQGSILTAEPPEFVYPNPTHLFLYIFKTTNIVDALTNGTAQFEGKENIGDQECYIISGEISKYFKYRVWIAPDRDFRPLKIEHYYGEGKEGWKTATDIKLEKIDGIWFPTYAEMVPVGDEDVLPITIKVLEVELNKKLPDKTFDIEFPHGTWVSNEAQDGKFNRIIILTASVIILILLVLGFKKIKRVKSFHP